MPDLFQPALQTVKAYAGFLGNLQCLCLFLQLFFQYGQLLFIIFLCVAVLFQQYRQLLQRTIQPCLFHRRRHMADQDCRCAPLGLRPFTRKIYDIGIDIRQLP